jgi:coenzyme Q-binding protein COQ10
LFNQWQFIDTDSGSDVIFELQFEFAVPLLRKIIAPMMTRVVERFIEAFEARARELYGAAHDQG